MSRSRVRDARHRLAERRALGEVEGDRRRRELLQVGHAQRRRGALQRAAKDTSGTWAPGVEAVVVAAVVTPPVEVVDEVVPLVTPT